MTRIMEPVVSNAGDGVNPTEFVETAPTASADETVMVETTNRMKAADFTARLSSR